MKKQYSCALIVIVMLFSFAFPLSLCSKASGASQSSNASYGIVQLTYDNSSENPSISSDGSKIACLTFLSGYGVSVIDPKTAESKKVANNLDSNAYPSISEDGSKIAYVSSNYNGNGFFIVNSDGTGIQKLADRGDRTYDSVISGDSSKVAFRAGESYNNNTEGSVFVISADGSGLKQLHNASDSTSVSICYDGSKVAFNFGNYSSSEIFVVNSDGSGLKQLTSSGDNSFPAISSEGSKVFFNSDLYGGYGIFVVNSDGSGLKQISNNADYFSKPSVSRDGAKITFRTRVNTTDQIFVVNSDGSDLQQITQTNGISSYYRFSDPSISGDGSKITYSLFVEGKTNVFLADLNSAASSSPIVTSSNSKAPIQTSTQTSQAPSLTQSPSQSSQSQEPSITPTQSGQIQNPSLIGKSDSTPVLIAGVVISAIIAAIVAVAFVYRRKKADQPISIQSIQDHIPNPSLPPKNNEPATNSTLQLTPLSENKLKSQSYIFISHVKEDANVALEIARGLEKAGYKTWFFERDSTPGQDYLVQTRMAIIQSQAFLLLVSSNSLASRQVNVEVVRAHECDRPFIPVLHEVVHDEIGTRRPGWSEALGATNSIEIPRQGVGKILPRIIEGLDSLKIKKELPTNIPGDDSK